MFQRDLHLFRGLAITCIVALHSLESFDWSNWPLVDRVLRALFASSSTLFFFISGYLFQHLSRKFAYGKYLQRKFETVVVPYLVVSVPALVISTSFIRQEGMWPWFYDLPIAQQVGLFLLTGKHLEPLWFVPTMIIYYVAAPLFLRIDRSPALYWLVAPLLALALAIGPSGPTGPLQKAVHYLPVYLIGMSVSHYRETVDRLTGRLLLPLVAVTGLLFLILIDRDGAPSSLFMPFKLLNAILLIYALRRAPEAPTRWMAMLAASSFAIYFIHGYVLSAFRLGWASFAGPGWSGNAAIFPPSLIGLAVHTAAVIAICLLIVKATQLTFPERSRQLIGA